MGSSKRVRTTGNIGAGVHRRRLFLSDGCWRMSPLTDGSPVDPQRMPQSPCSDRKSICSPAQMGMQVAEMETKQARRPSQGPGPTLPIQAHPWHPPHQLLSLAWPPKGRRQTTSMAPRPGATTMVVGRRSDHRTSREAFDHCFDMYSNKNGRQGFRTLHRLRRTSEAMTGPSWHPGPQSHLRNEGMA